MKSNRGARTCATQAEMAAARHSHAEPGVVSFFVKPAGERCVARGAWRVVLCSLCRALKMRV